MCKETASLPPGSSRSPVLRPRDTSPGPPAWNAEDIFRDLDEEGSDEVGIGTFIDVGGAQKGSGARGSAL